MEFVKTPVKGMQDILPENMRLKETVLSMIKQTYANYGFMQLETPAMEHLENLSGKQGGENEKLMFKVMKRGAELARALEKEGDELADSGLRYDLTLPLARYYAGNVANLPSPFKALQIGNVWRADKPQKGRYRQFTQCDIDILGDSSILAEIELIAATANMLTKIFSVINVENFTVHIGDRRILRAMAAYAGFEEDDFEKVFIILDKYDKIGKAGIVEELLKEGYPAEAINKYADIFDRFESGVSCASFCEFIGEEYLDKTLTADLDTIVSCAKSMVGGGVNIIFDPTFVRGMGYYTGTIFEISIDGYNYAIAGGGRYDDMVGKFAKQPVPAIGFSIGFERILMILEDNNYSVKMADNGTAFLIQSGTASEIMLDTFKKAASLRAEGKSVTVQPMKKNAKAQIERLMEDGFVNVERIYKD